MRSSILHRVKSCHVYIRADDFIHRNVIITYMGIKAQRYNSGLRPHTSAWGRILGNLQFPNGRPEGRVFITFDVKGSQRRSSRRWSFVFPSSSFSRRSLVRVMITWLIFYGALWRSKKFGKLFELNYIYLFIEFYYKIYIIYLMTFY